MRPRAFIVGAFGQGNPGDEALLSAFLRALPGRAPAAPERCAAEPLAAPARGAGAPAAPERSAAAPVVASAAPELTAATHGVRAVRRDDTRAIGRAIRASDAVVVAGGTIFKTLHPACGRARHALLARTVALAAAARALRKPFALVGVGAGALDGAVARRLARRIVSHADLLVLRDEESAARLAEAGVPTPLRVGADAAWTLLPPAHGSAQRDAPVVVALSHLAGGSELGGRLAAGLEPLLDSGVRVHLQPWQRDAGEGGDELLAAEVAGRLDDRPFVLPPPTDLIDARESFASARAVVALRFHAVPAAAAAGVPVLAYAHEPKLAGSARRLGQPSVSPDDPAERLAGAALGLLDAEPPAAASVELERSRAEDGFRLLRVLLARGRSEEAVHVDGLDLRPEEWLG